MSHRPSTRPRQGPHKSRLWRVFAVLILALCYSGIARAAEEAVEAVVHVAETGHGAHTQGHPEGGSHADPEHFCFGPVHHCGCCPTSVAVPHSTAAPLGSDRPETVSLTWRDGAVVEGIHKRIDRPPRA